MDNGESVITNDIAGGPAGGPDELPLGISVGKVSRSSTHPSTIFEIFMAVGGVKYNANFSRCGLKRYVHVCLSRVAVSLD